ncbi:MAG: hypothetical protein ACXAC8_10300 [Candidatus Hodarchaeales archaeon]
MHQNLIAVAGLSHSGKDLLLGQILKLGRTELQLEIHKNVVYYDWLEAAHKKQENQYLEKLLPSIRQKILMKLNTLIYIHDISYQRLDDIMNDFEEIISNIRAVNKNFQVILLLNRGHLIPNEAERNKIKSNVLNRLQQIYPHEILSYIVSLKGPDEQRLTNLIFTQIINKAADFTKRRENLAKSPVILDQEKQIKIEKILKKNMSQFGYAGAFLLSQSHEIILAVGKSQNWQEKLGPQIIRMLDQYRAFDITPTAKPDVLRIEDFLMISQGFNSGLVLVLIGKDSVFQFNLESYSTIEQICLDIAREITSDFN